MFFCFLKKNFGMYHSVLILWNGHSLYTVSTKIWLLEFMLLLFKYSSLFIWFDLASRWAWFRKFCCKRTCCGESGWRASGGRFTGLVAFRLNKQREVSFDWQGVRAVCFRLESCVDGSWINLENFHLFKKYILIWFFLYFYKQIYF